MVISADRSPAIARILEGLTPAQAEAVTHGDGPLLVVAGPGTGKTTVLTRRLAYLVTAKRARPAEILALTFTDKAAAEMEERVDLLLPYGYADIWISTFHAFGDRILRDEALEIGLTTNLRVLTRAEQNIFLRQHLFDLPLERYRPLGDPARHVDALLTLFSRAKDEDVEPAAYLAYAEGLAAEAAHRPEDRVAAEEAARNLELARAAVRYQELLLAAGLIDFGDQVALTLRLFRERPAALARYRERFRFILVDEFQDTNRAQWELVRLLAGQAGNLTVVGDDDQGIYRFRGAAVSNILGFRDAYPEVRIVVLGENFRSPQPILDVAYRLIRHNDPDRLEVRAGIDKRLTGRPADPGTEGPTVLGFETLSEEADGVAGRIAAEVERGRSPRDFAILVRTNRNAGPFLRALNMQGIPWRFSGGQGLYGREEVRVLISFLRAVADPEDSVSLYHLAASEFYRMPALDLARLSSAADRAHRPLRRALEAAGETEEISPEGRAVAARLLEDLRRYTDLARDRPTGEVLYRFLTDSGALKRLAAAGSPAAEARIRNMARFFEVVKRFEDVAVLDRPREFVAHLTQLLEAGDDPPAAELEDGTEAVQVLTLHKAKGLEFPIVFLVDLVSDRFPSRRRREPLPLPDALIRDPLPEGDAHIQEERRLFYVGMTRAREALFLTWARDQGGTRPKKVSPFVQEALDLPRAGVAARRPAALEALERHAPRVEEAPAGEWSIPEDGVLTLSHYQVDDYLTCPLKYKYVHILRVPIREHHSVVYGKALHDAISAYLRRRAQGKGMSLAELLAAFEGSWTNEGFLSREHEEERLRAGRAALERFHRDEEGARVRPAMVEALFSFVLGRDRVVGRWDRIDAADGRVAIIDYKSSQVRDQKEADRKAEESLQLGIYALAYRETRGVLPDQVELRFLESGLAGRAGPSEGRLDEIRERIRTVAAGIRTGDFTARPSWLACSYCAYRGICPYTAAPPE